MDNFLLKMCLRGANRETDMELFALIQFKIRFEKKLENKAQGRTAKKYR